MWLPPPPSVAPDAVQSLGASNPSTRAAVAESAPLERAVLSIGTSLVHALAIPRPIARRAHRLRPDAPPTQSNRRSMRSSLFRAHRLRANDHLAHIVAPYVASRQFEPRLE